MLCQRARQLLAPPRGPLSAIGGIDSLRQSAGFPTARLRAVESTRVGQCPRGEPGALLPTAGVIAGAPRAATAARSLPVPAASISRPLPASSACESHSNF